MTDEQIPRIVVGVDGSAGSVDALSWAVQEARLRATSVHTVMAWQHPSAYGASNAFGLGMDPSFGTQQTLASLAEGKAAQLVDEASQVHEVPITWEAIEGHPALALLSTVGDSDLLVVGSRGHGGFVGALLGSVSQHVVTHAHCAVVVIPGRERSKSHSKKNSDETDASQRRS